MTRRKFLKALILVGAVSALRLDDLLANVAHVKNYPKNISYNLEYDKSKSSYLHSYTLHADDYDFVNFMYSDSKELSDLDISEMISYFNKED